MAPEVSKIHLLWFSSSFHLYTSQVIDISGQDKSTLFPYKVLYLEYLCFWEID